MKKQVFGLFVAMLMLLCLLPSVALAEEILLTQDNIGSNMTLTDGNTYKLDGDITISSTINITGTVTLDLNGHVLKMNSAIYGGSAIGQVILVGTNSDTQGFLTLKDSNPSAVHKFNSTDAVWKLDETNGTKTVTGGVITGGDSHAGTGAADGGGIRVAYGSLKMEGGNIVGCQSEGAGGGVYVKNNTSFEMTGGSIANCSAVLQPGGYGGCICMYDGATFTISGDAAIGAGSADKAGASIYLDNATMYAESGSVEGDIYFKGTSSLTISENGSLLLGGAVTGKSHLATFKDGESTIAFTHQNGNTVNKPADPTKKGYTFLGWYDENEVEFDFANTQITGNITLYARWKQDSGSTTRPTYHTVRATAGEGGSLSETIVSLRPDESFTFEFTPNAGYAVADVKVDGKSVGAVESYTFRNLSADKTLEVEFAPIGSTATGTPADADKNPNTGANDALGVAAGLAGVALMAAFAANKKR